VSTMMNNGWSDSLGSRLRYFPSYFRTLASLGQSGPVWAACGDQSEAVPDSSPGAQQCSSVLMQLPEYGHHPTIIRTVDASIADVELWAYVASGHDNGFRRSIFGGFALQRSSDGDRSSYLGLQASCLWDISTVTTTPGFDTHSPAMHAFTLLRGVTYYWSCSILSVALLTLTAPGLHAFPCWAEFSKADFPNCQQLTTSYSLHWRIASGNITFGIALNATASWVGLGISEAGGAPTLRGPSFQLQLHTFCM
jgi:hypothetical protein